MTGGNTGAGVILIRGGRVYRHDGNVDLPEVADVLVADGRVAAVRANIVEDLAQGRTVPELGARGVDEVIEAEDRLVIPGFVNAHYHSHDVLLKGCFETIPLEFQLLNALPPAYPKRSAAEIRVRTLLGAIEAESAFVAGALSGRLTASTVVLAGSACVEADITHVALTIDQGAVFQGHSRRVDSIDKAKSTSLLALPASPLAVSTPLNGHKNGSAADDKGQSAAAAS